jgi:hypothetical protein
MSQYGSVPRQPRGDFIAAREQNLDYGQPGKSACRSHILRPVWRACNESIGSDVLAEDIMR